MKLPGHFTNPKPNPEIADTVRAIRRHLKELNEMPTFTAQKGVAHVLMAQLEHFVSLPAHLEPLLAPGAVDGAAHWIADAEISGPTVRVLSGTLFDPGEAPESRMFICANNRLSRFIWNNGNEPLAGAVGPVASMVQVLEALWVSPHATQMHLTQPRAVEELGAAAVEQTRAVAGGDFLVFCDPNGLASQGGAIPPSLVLACTANQHDAERVALEISEAAQLRTAVARQVALMDWH